MTWQESKCKCCPAFSLRTKNLPLIFAFIEVTVRPYFCNILCIGPFLAMLARDIIFCLAMILFFFLSSAA